MFTGKYDHTIDDNNRLALPSGLRKQVDESQDGKKLFITPGFDGCLAIYPQRQFEELTEKLKQLMFTSQKARTFNRLFFSRSDEVSGDKQGRIIIPEPLKEHAGLKREVTILGVMDRIEVWDSERWNEFNAEHTENFESDAEDLFQ